MDKKNIKNGNKKVIRINKNNNIYSNIEFFIKFGKKYDVYATKLEDNIQYETNKIKITQTYESSILNNDINEITRLLKNKGKISLIIINNLKKNEKEENKIKYKIKEISKLKNIKIFRIEQKNIFKTVDKIIQKVG